ncbi:MAG TPA: efflux RND transporter periplasmic adaptor subunit [Candidatus Dormibacteraeota bacterium]|nr:efflux RND transporter periplasmic adaptor subunit [Candidatus Dormibacteraeota bacterium]
MKSMNSGPKLGFLIASAVLGLSACSTRQQLKAPSAETVRNVPVLWVQQTSVPDLLEAVGTVRAGQTSDVASQMMGNIVEISAHEGDHVQRGQVLAVIDDSQPRAAVDRATAAELAARQQLVGADSDLVLAESTLKRYQTLFEKKSVSPQEFDEVKARQQSALARRDMAKSGQTQAQAALSQAHTSLDYTRIRAPFDGVVTEKKADSGTLASPGTPIFTVEDVRRYRLEATVNENDLRYVRIGQQVSVAIDALDNMELRGRVGQIVPVADAASRTFLVKIELPAETRLRSGLFGRARFSRGERQTLLIPRSAVVERGQLQGIYVLDQNQIASLRYITLGKPSGTEVEVLAGLENGERLVAKPGTVDLNSKRIEVQ